ncbi:Centromere protein X [Arachis hypogaea]|nr:Centromere protein X [Arachis hypogaea]
MFMVSVLQSVKESKPTKRWILRQELELPRRVGQLLLRYYGKLDILKNTHASVFSDTVNGNALKLSCELVRVFVTEAVQRAAAVAEAEGSTQIEPSHLEFILPQLLLDF